MVAREKNININICFLYIFSIFYAFIVSGAHSKWYALVILGVILYVSANLDIQISIRIKSIISAALFSLVFSLLNYTNMNADLNGDQLYHVSRSYELIINIVKKYHNLFSNFSYISILHAYSILLTSIFIFLHILYQKRRIFTVISLCLAALPLVFLQFYNFDPHPPVRNLPVILAGLFPSTNGYRLQGIIAIFVLGLWVFEKNWLLQVKILFLVCAVSMPVVYFNSAIVEFSIWSFVLNTIFLVKIASNEKFTKSEIIIFAFAISLGSLIRQSLIADFAILFILFLISERREKNTFLAVFIISLPVFLFLSLTKGISPASYVPDEKFIDVPSHMSFASRILYSIQLDNLKYLWATSGMIFPFFVSAVLLKKIYQNKGRTVLIMVTWFVLYWCLFHLIRPVLWGVPRYQMEYIAPLSIVAMYFVLAENGRWGRMLASLTIFLNFYLISVALDNMHNYRPEYEAYYLGKTPYLSELPFNLDEAIKKTRAECNGGLIKFSGDYTTYGDFPVILSGVNVENYYFSKNKDYLCVYNLVFGKTDGFYNQQRNTTVVFSKLQQTN